VARELVARIEFMRVARSGNGNVTRVEWESYEKCLANSGDAITRSYQNSLCKYAVIPGDYSFHRNERNL